MLETKLSALQEETITALPAKGYAAQSAKANLDSWNFERRPVGQHDVLIQIRFCGVCHTDIHFVNNDLGFSVYPMVPGTPTVQNWKR